MGAHRTPVFGLIDCPTCGFDMDVKKDKNGHAMGYCPDCSQQLFTRNDHRSGKLLERMRACAPEAAAPAPAAPARIAAPTAPASSASASTKAAPRVQEHKQDTNTTTDTNTAPKPPGAWFAPLLGASARKEPKHA